MTMNRISVGVALLLAATAGTGWAGNIGYDIVTKVGSSSSDDSLYIFSVEFFDTTGGAIDYFGDPFCVSEAMDQVDDMHPRLVMDADGNAHVVWMHNKYGEVWEILYSVVAPNGDILIDSTWISTLDGMHSAYPAIALDSAQDAHIVWMDKRDEGIWEIYYQKVRPHLDEGYAELLTDENVRLSDNDGFDSGRFVDPYAEVPPEGGIFSIQKKFWNVLYRKIYEPNEVQFIEHPDLVVDPDGYVHIVWSDSREDHGHIYWNIYYQKQTNDPIPQVLIDDTRISYPGGIFDACSPSVCVGVECEPYVYSIHIVWQQLDGWDEWSIWYRKQKSTTGEYIVPNTEVSHDDTPDDDRHSASPDVSADVDDYVHIAFMTNRDLDPGHIPPDKEDIHIDGQWEVYVFTLKPSSGSVEPYRTPKRESDLTNHTWPPGEWEPWGDSEYGYYTGPGSPASLPDGPSVYPRIVSQEPMASGKTRVVWHDYRWGFAPHPNDWRSWEIFYTEMPNWCKNPHEDVRLTDSIEPDMYPDVDRVESSEPDVKWQMRGGDWEIYNSHWNQGDGEEYVRLVISGDTEEYYYYCYRSDPTDEDATDGITYVWSTPLLPGEYTYHFEAKRGGYFDSTPQRGLEVQ